MSPAWAAFFPTWNISHGYVRDSYVLKIQSPPERAAEAKGKLRCQHRARIRVLLILAWPEGDIRFVSKVCWGAGEWHTSTLTFMGENEQQTYSK